MLESRRDYVDIFDDALHMGRIDTIEVEDARGKVVTFSLPDLHRAKQNALTNAGPDMPRTTP
jgi:hypothetical protein